jgi:uncharacterized protein DUF4145
MIGAICGWGQCSGESFLDGYTLTAELFKAFMSMVAAFAWPAGILGIAWLFRKRLNDLLPKLILKHKEWQLSFRLDELEEEVKELPPPPANSEVAPNAIEITRLEQLAKISPRAAIMEARADVEQAVQGFAEAMGLTRDSYMRVIRTLGEKELVDSKTIRALNDLRHIGNMAAHNKSNPTENDALRYQALAQQLIRQFNISAGAAQMPVPQPMLPGMP